MPRQPRATSTASIREVRSSTARMVQHRTYKDLRRLATVDKHAGLSPRSALAEQNAQKLKIAGYAGCADK